MESRASVYWDEDLTAYYCLRVKLRLQAQGTGCGMEVEGLRGSEVWQRSEVKVTPFDQWKLDHLLNECVFDRRSLMRFDDCAQISWSHELVDSKAHPRCVNLAQDCSPKIAAQLPSDIKTELTPWDVILLTQQVLCGFNLLIQFKKDVIYQIRVILSKTISIMKMIRSFNWRRS